jgi:antitoxin component YwqK of YwqJK toxin-antitoxin module
MNTPLPASIGQPAASALEALNITSLEELAKMTEEELTDLHGVGPKAIDTLKQCLDENKMCLLTPKGVKPKKAEIIDGYMIKYHANGVTRWSKGKVVDGQPDGYWEWYRPDGTLKRSGHFKVGEAVGEWTTYDDEGKVYKVTNR